jgi:uncharacterized protein YqgQ
VIIRIYNAENRSHVFPNPKDLLPLLLVSQLWGYIIFIGDTNYEYVKATREFLLLYDSLLMDTNFIMVRILIMQKGKDERYS